MRVTGRKERLRMKKVLKVTAVLAMAAVVIMGLAACGTEKTEEITKDQAVQIALNQVQGAGTSDVIRSDKTVSDGNVVYDITIIYDGSEYDFEISASDGSILEQDSDKVAALPAAEAGSTGKFSLDDAKAAALAEVEGATASDIVKAKKGYDDGVREYEIEIHYNGLEHDFTYNAISGEIIEKSVELLD